ncbi:MAG: GNAT family N-acetyltransferase [Zoogloeaceae bacterium]|jgi:N-acetylglutamate synthase-like GNAT family acetyltransferase|nr:GNAT family N-acetyltransferase [Zoogloeaceae bacterium]
MMNDQNIRIEHYPAGVRDDRFWISMGPLFFDKNIKKQLPFLTEDLGKNWFIAFDGDVVIGFASVDVKKNGVAMIGSAWVSESKRKRGTYRALTDARLALASEKGAKLVRAVCTTASSSALMKRGFAEVNQRGKYHTLEKKLEGGK